MAGDRAVHDDPAALRLADPRTDERYHLGRLHPLHSVVVRGVHSDRVHVVYDIGPAGPAVVLYYSLVRLLYMYTQHRLRQRRQCRGQHDRLCLCGLDLV